MKPPSDPFHQGYRSPPAAGPGASLWTAWGPLRILGLAALLVASNFSCQILVHSFGASLFLPVLAGAICGVLLPVAVIFHGQGFSFGADFRLQGASPGVMAVSALVALAALAPTSLLAELSVRLHPPDPDWADLYAGNFMPSATGVALALAAGVILAPLVEEMIFRGLIQRLASRAWGPVPAVLVSGLVFGLVHGEPWFLFGLVGVGWMLGFVFEATGSLTACWVAHAVHNGVSLWLLYQREGDLTGPTDLQAGDWALGAGSLVALLVLGRILIVLGRGRVEDRI